MILMVLLQLSHGLVQLIKFLPHLYQPVDYRYQLFIGASHAIVHISHDKVEVTYDIWVDLVSLQAHLLDKLTHHLVSLVKALLSVHEMNIYDIEQVVVELERYLHAALVPHEASDPGRHRALLLVLHMLDMLRLDEDDKEHLPHGDLPDTQEAEGPKVIREIHHDGVLLRELCLLSTDHDQVELLRLREYLLHLEDLLLPIHIEGHGENSETLSIACNWS